MKYELNLRGRHDRNSILLSAPPAYLHDVEQALLAEAILLLEEVVLWVCTGYVASDELLARRDLAHVVGILLLVDHLRATKQWPHEAAEVRRNAFSD